MNITQQRQRALEIITEKTKSDTYYPFDYALDTLCRDLLGLPVRPEGTLPYGGWMKGKKSESVATRRISVRGIELIKRWEGCRLNAYVCPAGVLTIGYGHTGKVSPGMKITHSQAEQLLIKDLKRFELMVNQLVTVALTQSQFDALVSFTFNVGINAFRNSTLLRKLNKRDYNGASNEFLRWVNGGGKQLHGLVRRRQAERELFRT